MATCEIKLFQNYFGLPRRPCEIILFQHVETCIKLFQNYFSGLLQLLDISHMFNVALKITNNFRPPSAAGILLFQFHTWLHVKQELIRR